MIDIGSARLGIIVAERLRRKRKITSTTRPSVIARVNFTSCTEARIDSERSNSTCSDTDCGSCALELREQRPARPSATATVFVPGWRWTARITERASTNQAAVLSFSTLSNTSPSSSSRTGGPPR